MGITDSKNAEPPKPKKTEAQMIEDDQKKSHAVFFLDCAVDDELLVEDEIEQGLLGLQARAENAGMEVMGPPAILKSSYYDETDACGHMCITVILAWMSKETMDKLRLQQSLAGGGGAPPAPPRNPMRRA